jgi:hypothetical protein
MPVLVSLEEFVDQIDATKFEHHRNTIKAALSRLGRRNAAYASNRASEIDIKDETVEEHFERMKHYARGRYLGVRGDPYKFMLEDGSVYDCVAYEEQPTYVAARDRNFGLPAKPPAPSQLAPPDRTDPNKFGPTVLSPVPPLLSGGEDRFGNKIKCPERHVPLRRLTVAKMAQLGEFDNFFRKDSPEPPYIVDALGGVHHHAVCNEVSGTASTPVEYFGCSTSLNVWKVDPSPGAFSLSQLWLRGSAGNAIQTIESGWSTYPSMWGTSPILFVYYNPNGYDRSGGYISQGGYIGNSDHIGFIPYPDSGWILLGPIPQPYSAKDSDQYAIRMQWEIDDQGNWWCYLGVGDQPPTPLGHFPAEAYQNGTLAKSAQELQFGGEVSSRFPGEPGYYATGPMGTGTAPLQSPDDSYREVAFQKQLAVQLKLRDSLVPAKLQVLADPHDIGYSATATQATDSGSATWGSYMFFGGSSMLRLTAGQ